MSGAFIKTFSLLSFLILAVGLAVASPGVDATNSADNPYTAIDTNAAELNSLTIYVANGASVDIIAYYDEGSEIYTVTSVTDGYGLTLTTTDTTTDIYLTELSGTISHTGTIQVVVDQLDLTNGVCVQNTFSFVVVEAASGGSDNTFTDYTDEIDDGGDSGDSGSGDSGDSGSGDGESGSGDDSGDSGDGDSGDSGSEGGESDSGSSSDDSGSGSADDNGGSSSDSDQSSAGDDNSDGSEEDLSDSSAVERQSSPVLAIIILVAGALLIWWVIKKVR